MKKRVAYLVGSLVVLAGIVLGILYYNGTFESIDPSDFAVKKTDRIGKIYMADKHNNAVTLEKKGKDHWVVNGKYKARQSSVEGLLRTIRLIEGIKPIPEAATENVTRGMMVENTKVEIYERDGDLIKAYYVGAEAQNTTGNYMLREGADEIYVVQIPGLKAVLHTRYNTDATTWRDRSIFSYKPGEISQIKMDYTFIPEGSFQLDVISRDSFSLQPLYPSEVQDFPGEPHDRDMAQFVNNFRDIRAEAFSNNYSKKDSILNLDPFCVITVTDTTGKQTTAELYYKPVTRRTKQQVDPQGNRLKYDRERSFALINDGKDFVIIQQFVFGKIMRQYKHFLREGGLPQESP